MPTQGLSLVGFMPQDQALNHLKTVCVPPPGATDATLLAEWAAAQAKLGPAVAGAGLPKIVPIPTNHPHIQRLLNVHWAGAFQPLLAAGATFQMVEVDPLLAFQATVDTERSNSHCSVLGKTPSDDDLMAVCLPLVMSTDAIHASQQAQSMIIKSRSLNLVITAEGPLQSPTPTVGVQFNWALPFVHVVRWNGQCFLHNGYHRAYGVRTAGATSIPCIFRDVQDAAAAGIRSDGGTFTEATMLSTNPPTIAHYSQGRSHDVMLRASMRIIQFSWSQHTMFDE